MKQKLALGAALGALAAFAVVEACAVYGDSLLLTSDGGVEAGGDARSDAALDGGCGSRRWPARPEKDDPSTTPDLRVTNALRTLDFGLRDGGLAVAFGFDLDGLCSCNPDPESCRTIALDGAPPPPKQCDFEGGVDNSLAGLLGRFSQFPNFFAQDYINGQISKGVYGAVMRVSKYNGQLNDVQVEVQIFSSNGTEGTQLGTPAVPKFDGTDLWTVDPAGLLGGTIPDGGEPTAKEAVDTNAYVSNGVLVANLNFPLSVGAANNDGTVTIELTGSVVAAKLVKEGSTFRIEEGVITGRWPTKKMLPALQVLHDPFNLSLPLCGANTTYQLLKGEICKVQDLSPNVLEDGKNAPCSALSVGFGFTAYPAGVGGTHPRVDGGFPCGLQWDDSCTQ